MATTRDRYILDVDTRSATRAVENLRRSIDQLGGGAAQQRVRQLQQSLNSINTRTATREIGNLQQRLQALGTSNMGNLPALPGMFAGAGAAAGRLLGVLARFGPVGATIGGVVVAAGALVAPFVAAARAIEPVEQRLRLVTNGSIDLANTMSTLRDSAAATRTEFTAFADLYTKLTIATESLGTSQKDVLAATENLSRALAVAGADAATTESVIRQFGQAMASGVVRGDEFNSLVEGLGPALSIMARETGITVGQLREMANEGQLTAQVMLNMLLNSNELNRVFAEMGATTQQTEQTLSGSFNRLMTAMAQYMGEITGFGEAYRSLLDDLNERANVLARTAEGARIDQMLGEIDFNTEPLDRIILRLGDVGEIAGEVERRINALRQERGEWRIFGRSDAEIDADIARLREIQAELDQLLRDQYQPGVDLVVTIEDQATAPIRDIIDRLNAYSDATAEARQELEAAQRAQAEAAADIERLTAALGTEAAQYEDINQLLEIARQRHIDLSAVVDDLEKKINQTPFDKYYDSLITGSEQAAQRTTFVQQALERLNQQFAANAISPEVYAQALERLNREMQQIDSNSYIAYLDRLMVSTREGIRETDYLNRAISDLQASIVKGGTAEELEAWRAALAKLTPDSFNAFYSSLIETAQGTVRESDYAKQAIEALNESLSKGVISPQVYAEAMKKLNSSIDSTQIKTYQTVLAELNTTFAESQANAAVNADAMAALTEQFSNQIISLEQYRAGISALGSSFDEYLLSIGDINAYLQNLQSTVENSMRADENKAAAIRQLTQAYEAGSMAPELYAQMMRALGADIEFTAEQLRRLGDEFSALTGTAEASLAAMEERIRAAQEQAELAGYDGVERALRSIILEENRLRDATIERLRAQALANGVSEDVLNEQIARIEEQTRATIAARQQAARVEEANRRSVEKARELTRPRTSRSRRRTRSEPESLWDRIFGGANAGGGSGGEPDGSKANPFYVIPVFGGLKDMLDNITKRVVNASDLTGNVTGVLQSLSAPIASANRQAGFLGSLFGGYFATGGNIPAGRYGIVGESGPEVVEGPATVTPITGQQVVYNINAVDVRSFQDMLARDPGFVHAVVQRAQRRVPGAR